MLYPIRGKRVVWGVVIVFCVCQLNSVRISADDLGEQWTDYYDASRLCVNIPEPIVCRKPSITWLISGKKCLEYPHSTPDVVWDTIHKHKKSVYAIIDGFKWTQDTRRYLVPAVSNRATIVRRVGSAVIIKTY